MPSFDLDQTASNVNSAINQIIDSSTDLNIDSATLFVDKSTNRVGIGTTTPQVALEVHGEIRINRAGDRKIEFNDPDSNTEDWTIEHNESSLWFYNQTDADSVLVLKDNGNVGIGTSGPSGNLHIEGASGSSAQLYITDGDATGITNSLLIAVSGNNASIYNRKADATLRLGTNDQNDIFKIIGTGTPVANTLVLYDGNVGIGTTSPQGNLGIGSTNGVGDETNPAFVIGPSAYRLGIWTDGETAIFNNKNGDDGFLFKVKTAGYALKIDGITGNIGIGTTAPATLTHLVEANTNTTQNTFNGLTISNTQDTNNNGSAITFSSSTGANSQAKIGAVYKDRTGSSEDTDLFFTVLGGGSASEAMRIKSDGDIGIGTTNPSSKLHVASGNIRIDNGYWIGQGDYRFLFHDSYGIKHIVKEQVSAPSVGDGQVVFWIDTDASTNGDLMVTAGSNSSSSSFNLGSI